jgi:hypothetical protein
MNKIFGFFLLLSVISMFLFSGCSNSIWSGTTYTGTLTKEDTITTQWYYDTYKIYCAGKWSFSFTSDDNVKIYMEAIDLPIRIWKFVDLDAKKSTNTITVNLVVQTEINVYVNKDNPDWASNGNKAGYSFTATLKN